MGGGDKRTGRGRGRGGAGSPRWFKRVNELAIETLDDPLLRAQIQ